MLFLVWSPGGRERENSKRRERKREKRKKERHDNNNSLAIKAWHSFELADLLFIIIVSPLLPPPGVSRYYPGLCQQKKCITYSNQSNHACRLSLASCYLNPYYSSSSFQLWFGGLYTQIRTHTTLSQWSESGTPLLCCGQSVFISGYAAAFFWSKLHTHTQRAFSLLSRGPVLFVGWPSPAMPECSLACLLASFWYQLSFHSFVSLSFLLSFHVNWRAVRHLFSLSLIAMHTHGGFHPIASQPAIRSFSSSSSRLSLLLRIYVYTSIARIRSEQAQSPSLGFGSYKCSHSSQ